MMVRGFFWIERRLRPAEGWLPVLLLLAIILLLVLAVDAVDWAPEAPVVFVTGISGLLLAIVLARRPLGWLPAWLLLITYGLLITTAWLGRLAPAPGVILSGWAQSSAHIRHNWGLLIDRAGGWLAAVSGGGRTSETIVFAFGLGLLAWLLAAFAGWTTFRLRRPLLGLALLTLGLALNNYFGRAELWSLPVFVGLLVALVAVVHQTNREAEWTRRRVDYPNEIRLELLAYSAAIALFLLFGATALPAINFRALSKAVLNRPAVEQAEQTLERVFAGVRQPGPASPAGESVLESGGSQGTLPRSLLLGAPPELYETVVMTATAQGDLARATHWRGLSYDIYSGRGWVVSAESRQPVAAGQDVPLPPVASSTVVSQTVHAVSESARIRYTLGLPLRFDQGVTTRWRGLDDLSRVEGQGRSYTAASRLPAATVAQLRAATLDDVPPALMARYTALPDSIPERVHELASQVAASSGLETTAYDQAKALETFLRQYPYSLEVELPPAGRDPVDFFLFDLQAGYCDYYASSMVVLARSLGLPARLAAGYLAQTPGTDGLQTIYQINAHSWAEVYFAGYGWLEFEPTAAFPAEPLSGPSPDESDFGEPEAAVDVPPVPIPEPAPGTSPYFWLLLLIPLFLAGWLLWWARRRNQKLPADRAQWAYDRLRRRAGRLGQPIQPSQTPAEFTSAFLTHLDALGQGQLARRLDLAQLAPDIQRLTNTYAGRLYAQHKPPAAAALKSWRRIRRRLWLLTIIENLRTTFSRITPSS